MKSPKHKPIYTKARHEVYAPVYVQKKLQLHKKFVFSQMDAKETFFSGYASVVQFIPGSETNGQVPTAFLNLTLGHYNKFQIHTRDFIALAGAITELSEWLNQNANRIQGTLADQIEQYNTYQMKRWLESNELDQDHPDIP